MTFCCKYSKLKRIVIMKIMCGIMSSSWDCNLGILKVQNEFLLLEHKNYEKIKVKRSQTWLPSRYKKKTIGGYNFYTHPTGIGLNASLNTYLLLLSKVPTLNLFTAFLKFWNGMLVSAIVSLKSGMKQKNLKYYIWFSFGQEGKRWIKH